MPDGPATPRRVRGDHAAEWLVRLREEHAPDTPHRGIREFCEVCVLLDEIDRLEDNADA